MNLSGKDRKRRNNERFFKISLLILSAGLTIALQQYTFWEKRTRLGSGSETTRSFSPIEKRDGTVETDLDGDAAKLDLNRATLEEFEQLPGVGEKTAERILEFKKKHGSFHDIEEMMEVNGIGPLRFEKMKSFITVEDQHEKE